MIAAEGKKEVKQETSRRIACNSAAIAGIASNPAEGASVTGVTGQ
jgi:hypothetical protein